MDTPVLLGITALALYFCLHKKSVVKKRVPRLAREKPKVEDVLAHAGDVEVQPKIPPTDPQKTTFKDEAWHILTGQKLK